MGSVSVFGRQQALVQLSLRLTTISIARFTAGTSLMGVTHSYTTRRGGDIPLLGPRANARTSVHTAAFTQLRQALHSIRSGVY